MFYVHDIDGIRQNGSVMVAARQRNVTRRGCVPPCREREVGLAASASRESQAGKIYRQAIEREHLVEPLVHIQQIMSTRVTTIELNADLMKAWQLLQQEAIRQLVVVSPRNDVLGMVSEKDVLNSCKSIDQGARIAAHLTVADAMQSDIITTDPLNDIRRVAKVMALCHIDAMPVMREGQVLVGIVTRGDILKGFAEHPKLNLWV